MSEPRDGYTLRVNVSIEGPGYSGGRLVINEERAAGRLSLHDISQLLMELDELVKKYERM